MSAFAVCFRRDGAPVSQHVVADMLNAQGNRGSDAVDIHVHGSLGMGHRALWTTPEDRDRHQPLSIPGLPFTLVWDGRIDNRADLFARLNDDFDDTSCPDAELALRLLAQDGQRALPEIIGAYAFAVHDQRDNSVLLARDPVGHRSLSYCLSGSLLVAASEECGVLSHPEVPARINRQQLAVFCAYMDLNRGATYFEDVHRLLPGHHMRVTTSSAATTRFWSAGNHSRIDYRDNREYAEHFRELLELAVGCRTRGFGPLAVMTSGGLDSGPIAAIADRCRGGRPLHLLTWTFSDFPQCNEHHYVRELAGRLGAPLTNVDCDACAPFSDLPHWPVHPDTPDQDPYRRFLDRTYDTAGDLGARVVLNGTAGDNLYSAGHGWFWQLIARGELSTALAAAAWYARQESFPAFVRRALIGSLLPAAVQRRRRPLTPPAWLTEEAVELLPSPYDPWPGEHRHAIRPAQHRSCLSLQTSDFLPTEAHWSGRRNVEVRYPLRDRRIIEFMLRVPDDQLQLNDVTRPILRRAISDLLPESQLERRDKTDFAPVYRSGANAAGRRIDELLHRASAIWPVFIRENWLNDAGKSGQSTRDALLWTAVSIELWHNQVQHRP